MSVKPSKPPAGKRVEVEKVVPLRKEGLLAPKTGEEPGTYCGLGIEGDDLLFRNPDGSPERHKL